jgi:hypothetical protein
MIGAIGWFFGGPYAAIACFFVGAALIFIGLSKGDGAARPSILTYGGEPYPKISRLKSWHKYGLVVSILCTVVLICFGVYRYYYLPSQSTDTVGSGPLLPITPLESLTVSPIKLVFKDQTIGTTSSPQTVTVVNRGTAARIITGINITGNFSQTNDCGAELMVGDSCNVEVKFTPTTVGLTHGSLEISCHDPLFSNTNLFATVDFSGSGETSPAHPKVKPESVASEPHTTPHAKALPVPTAPPGEAAPQVRQPLDSNAIPEFLRPKPLAPDQVPPIPVRGGTSDGILEEIRVVLEKDRELDDLAGCPAGTSVDLRRVGADISYNRCFKQCIGSWKVVNPTLLDFGGIEVSHPDGRPTLAIVEIPCVPITAATKDYYGLCVTNQYGTLPPWGDCQVKKKTKVKTDYVGRLYITVHIENVDSVVRLWKEFAQWKPTTK